MKTSSGVARVRRHKAITPEPAGVRDVCDVTVVHLEGVHRARAALLPLEETQRLVELVSLLANPTRLRILLALQPRNRGRGHELCVCDLAIVTGASRSLTSHQLRLLRTAGLVVHRRAGKLAFYRLAEGPLTALLSAASQQVQNTKSSAKRRLGLSG